MGVCFSYEPRKEKNLENSFMNKPKFTITEVP